MKQTGEIFQGKIIKECADQYGTPVYIYSEKAIIQKCRMFREMPSAYGVIPYYAMKANSNRNLLRLIVNQGFGVDASTFNEVRRAVLAGIPYNKISLTSQEVPIDTVELRDWLSKGLQYNVCSIRQLKIISSLPDSALIKLSVRLHPGIGSGETATRNTGDNYACFGIHESNLSEANQIIQSNKLQITKAHVHIGSGADPEVWKQVIDVALCLVEKWFPDVSVLNLGGGFKEARMPYEKAADIDALGKAACTKFQEFDRKVNRKLTLEIEPGTFLIANAGALITKVIDLKRTGDQGFSFAILDGGMECNLRPALYNSQHPFFVVSRDGSLVFSEENKCERESENLIVVGSCCETGDSQCYENGHITERKLCNLQIGDYLVIGGCGAYCSTMTPFNYNSKLQIPEVLVRTDGGMSLIRKRQTLEQVIENEIPDAI